MFRLINNPSFEWPRMATRVHGCVIIGFAATTFLIIAELIITIEQSCFRAGTLSGPFKVGRVKGTGGIYLAANAIDRISHRSFSPL